MHFRGCSGGLRRKQRAALQAAQPTGEFPSAARDLYLIRRIGGASRDRTDDLIVANDALSQLSYSPTLLERKKLAATRFYQAIRTPNSNRQFAIFNLQSFSNL